jgi:hypothetical protein
MDIRVENEARVDALAIGAYHFTLPNRLILELDNYYFVIVLSRKIVSIFYLALNGFKFIIKKTYHSFYNNDVFIDLVIIQMVCIYFILKCPCLI